MDPISEKPTAAHLTALLLLAVSITLLNCLKPLHLDDPAYYYYAAHIAQHPLAPYDFEVYWDYQTQPANHLLAPPLLPYWWAVAISWLGDHPLLWKLWLLPFHVLLVLSLAALFRRFAPGLALPLVAMTVLSPALLPGLNLMLDVPALALGLTALVLFLNGCDRPSWPRILAAGLLAGLAMQTKYSSFVTPAVFLAYGLTQRRLGPAVAAAGAAWAVFAGWEGFVAWRHGESHFLVGLAQRSDAHGRLRPLVLALATMMGGLGPGVLLTGLAALTHSRRVVAGTAAAILLGCGLVGWLPDSFWQRIDVMFFGVLGLVLWGCVAVIAWRLTHNGRAVDWFLVLWLLLEIAAYFALSPFPAARRLLGVLVVATLLAGRLAARTPERHRQMVRLATVVSAVLGLGVALVDLREAMAAQEVAERTARYAAAEAGPTWLWATWGVQFYGCRAGMQPLTPGRSLLHEGDLLVVAEQQGIRPDLHLDQAPLRLLHTVTVADGLPFRTLLCYYSGGTPLQHHAGPRLRLIVYRVRADFVPACQGTSCRQE